MQTREANLNDAVVVLPGDSDITADDFKLSTYQNENDGASAFVDHHRVQLMKFGLIIGKGGYNVIDLHEKREIFKLELRKTVYRGGVDAGVVPYSVAEESAGGMLRAAFEHKFPAAAKKTSTGKDATEVRSFKGLAG